MQFIDLTWPSRIECALKERQFRKNWLRIQKGKHALFDLRDNFASRESRETVYRLPWPRRRSWRLRNVSSFFTSRNMITSGAQFPNIKFSGSNLKNIARIIKKKGSDMLQIRHNYPIWRKKVILIKEFLHGGRIISLATIPQRHQRLWQWSCRGF